MFLKRFLPRLTSVLQFLEKISSFLKEVIEALAHVKGHIATV